MNRRHFLFSLGALGAYATLAPRAATAPGVVRNLIVVLANGGWDPTYLFDPKPDSTHVDTGKGDWATFGDGALWFDAERPGVTKFFEEFGSMTTVINGLNVPSVAHGGCIQRLLTGFRDPTKPDIGAIVGHEAGQAAPMPYLDIGGIARPGFLGADMGYMGKANQLGGLIFRSEAITPPNVDGWARHYPEEDEYERIQAFVEARAQRISGDRIASGANARLHKSFLLGLQRGHALRGHEDFFANVGRGRDFANLAKVAVEALTAGVSRSVFLVTDGNFDTHTKNAEQAQLFDATFASMTELMKQLAEKPGRAGGSLIDETVVVLASEMGRTPVLNAQAGKDHWPITSCLVTGARIRGSQVLGSTDEGLGANTIDMSTGQASDSGQLLQAENIHASLLELFGADPASYFPNVPALRALHA
jgi:hypothetical protein